MTVKEWAERLDGSEYPAYTTKDEKSQADMDGIVIVLGYSDDLIEFDGAISEELGVGDGDTVFVDGDAGSVQTLAGDPKRSIRVRFAPGDGRTWAYETQIPHETFRVMEGEEIYCEGLVFRVDDVSVGGAGVPVDAEIPWTPLSDAEMERVEERYPEARYFLRGLRSHGFALCRRAPGEDLAP